MESPSDEKPEVVLEPNLPADATYAGPMIVKKGFPKAKWDWAEVRRVCFAEDLGPTELSKRFGIPVGTIARRKQRENWPEKARLEKVEAMKRAAANKKMTMGVWDEWMGLLRHDIIHNLNTIIERGPRDISKMTEAEIKSERMRIALFRDYQELITQNQTQGAKQRAMEREEYPAEHDAGEIDMAAMVVYTRQPRPLFVDQTAIDVTSEALARDKQVANVRVTSGPSFEDAAKIAPIATAMVKKAAGIIEQNDDTKV